MKLTCPVCHEKLIRNERDASCSSGHHFDYAKSGYLNLLLSQTKNHGDDPQMIRARTEFLASGAYAPLREELCRIIRDLRPETLVDLGCGEGYYTSGFEAQEKYGFDLSKDALKHAAKHDKNTQYCVASIFRLPLPDSCADAAVTCFAPFAGDEIMRILKPSGHFIFVTPGADHLFELKQLLYDTPYRNQLSDLETDLTLSDSGTLRYTFVCRQEELLNLFAMTPYAHRTPPQAKEKLRSVTQMQITAEFLIRTYTK